PAAVMRAVRRVDGIRVVSKGFVILRSVSFGVPPGGLIGLVGRNGAGKTTTLKSIIGIVPVAAGGISMEGADLLSVPGHRRARMGIGYMPEDRRLIGTLTVEENILMPAWAGRAAAAGDRLAYINRVMPEGGAISPRRRVRHHRSGEGARDGQVVGTPGGGLSLHCVQTARFSASAPP